MSPGSSFLSHQTLQTAFPRWWIRQTESDFSDFAFTNWCPHCISCCFFYCFAG
jgi:hypothetical protein